MAKHSDKRIYHQYNPVKIVLKILLALAAVLAAFLIFLYVYFQRFIVIDESGLKLDIPGYYAQQENAENSAE